MTRSRQSTAPRVQSKDRHPQRSGLMDSRGLPKKEGAGQYNWGKPTDVFVELGDNYKYNEDIPKYDNHEERINRESGGLGKIQVLKPEEFKALRATNSGWI